jgi:hypothetical protein
MNRKTRLQQHKNELEQRLNVVNEKQKLLPQSTILERESSVFVYLESESAYPGIFRPTASK